MAQAGFIYTLAPASTTLSWDKLLNTKTSLRKKTQDLPPKIKDLNVCTYLLRDQRESHTLRHAIHTRPKEDNGKLSGTKN